MRITWRRAWKWGDKTKLARGVRISPSFLSDILSGRRSCSGKLALKLEKEARRLGYRMPAVQWVWARKRIGNPLFGVR